MGLPVITTVVSGQWYCIEEHKAGQENFNIPTAVLESGKSPHGLTQRVLQSFIAI